MTAITTIITEIVIKPTKLVLKSNTTDNDFANLDKVQIKTINKSNKKNTKDIG